MHDDAIKGLSLGNWREDRDALQKEKAKCWQAAKKVEDAALKFLAEKQENPQKKLIGNEIRMLLYYRVERKEHRNTVLVRLEQST